MTTPSNPFAAHLETVTGSLSDRIRALDGTEVGGGCADCNAFQRLVADKYGRDAHAINVYHDETCPTLAALGGGR